MSNENQNDILEQADQYLTEQMLMQDGIVPNRTIDTLLMYAFAQPGVTKADLEISPNETNPFITYKIEQKYYRLIQIFKRLKTGGIFSKILALILYKTFKFNHLSEQNIQELARRYLPPSYAINVEIKSSSRIL